MTTPIYFVEFVEKILRVRQSRAQKVVARVVIDRVEPKDLSADEREIARKLFGDIDVIPPEARDVFVGIFGARSGKTYIFGALYLLWRALVADLSTLAPGEVAVGLAVAPDLRLARQLIRYALGAAKSVPSIAALIESENADGFILRRPDGKVVSIEALPATRGGSALRGRSLVGAVLDEAAFFRDESFAVNDTELFKAVAPRILPGGMVVIITTPWAEAGLSYDEFERNFGHPVTAIACRAPTSLMRDDSPRILAMVERERVRDPDNARREFDTEFWGMGTGLFFVAEACRASVTVESLPKTDASLDVIVGVGGDLALVRDAAALVVVHKDGDFYDVAEVIERKPAKGTPLKLSSLVVDFSEAAARHGCHEICVDNHVLEPAREHLPAGMTLEACPGGQQGKIDTYTEARNIIHSGLLRIPVQYRRIAEQLREVVSKPTTGGGLIISSPRRGGSHGDLASALILALHAASQLTSGVGPAWLKRALTRGLPQTHSPRTAWQLLLADRGFCVARYYGCDWWHVYQPDRSAAGALKRPAVSQITGQKIPRPDAPSATEQLPILRIQRITKAEGRFWDSRGGIESLKSLGQQFGARTVHLCGASLNLDHLKMLRTAGLRPYFHEISDETEPSAVELMRRMFTDAQVSCELPEHGGLDAIRSLVLTVARSEVQPERVTRFGFESARGTIP